MVYFVAHKAESEHRRQRLNDDASEIVALHRGQVFERNQQRVSEFGVVCGFGVFPSLLLPRHEPRGVQLTRQTRDGQLTHRTLHSARTTIKARHIKPTTANSTFSFAKDVAQSITNTHVRARNIEWSWDVGRARHNRGSARFGVEQIDLQQTVESLTLLCAGRFHSTAYSDR